MPIIRNPFRKQDENVRPASTLNGVEHKANGTPNAKPIDIREKEPAEYKLSEINDSGVYLPPSPPGEGRKSFWTTSSSRSTTSSAHRSLLAENNHHEPFNISRESFDSYRRSFDISARSPVIDPARPTRASLDTRALSHDSRLPPRISLDSKTFQPPPPRSSNSFTRPSQVPAQTTEERESEAGGFEDVDIVDFKVPVAPAPKKRGLFSRITDSGDRSERPTSADGSGGGNRSWHSLGRKRGQSGNGSELGSLVVKRETTPKLESQLRKESPLQQGKPQVVDGKSPQPALAAAVPPPPTQKIQQQEEKEISGQPAAQTTESNAQAQAPTQAGAQQEVQQAQSGMETLELDDDQQKDVTMPPDATAASKDENPGVKAPKSQEAPQAPSETRVDS